MAKKTEVKFSWDDISQRASDDSGLSKSEINAAYGAVDKASKAIVEENRGVDKVLVLQTPDCQTVVEFFEANEELGLSVGQYGCTATKAQSFVTAANVGIDFGAKSKTA